jgi:hypothetical protein
MDSEFVLSIAMSYFSFERICVGISFVMNQ